MSNKRVTQGVDFKIIKGNKTQAYERISYYIRNIQPNFLDTLIAYNKSESLWGQRQPTYSKVDNDTS